MEPKGRVFSKRDRFYLIAVKKMEKQGKEKFEMNNLVLV